MHTATDQLPSSYQAATEQCAGQQMRTALMPPAGAHSCAAPPVGVESAVGRLRAQLALLPACSLAHSKLHRWKTSRRARWRAAWMSRHLGPRVLARHCAHGAAQVGNSRIRAGVEGF